MSARSIGLAQIRRSSANLMLRLQPTCFGQSNKGVEKMGPTFRMLTAADPALENMASLMEEMQRHYNVPCPPRNQILAGLNDRPPNTEILVAIAHDRVLAFCAFSAIYPGPGLKAGIFLKEIYVSEACRSQGLGYLLMKELAALAARRGLTRIDWTADASDPRLLAFYDGIGALRKPEKMFYRLDGEALLKLGAGSE